MNALIKPVFDEEAVREDLEEIITPEDYLDATEMSFLIMNMEDIIESFLTRNEDIYYLKLKYQNTVRKVLDKEKEKHLDREIEKKRQDFYLI